MLKEVTQPEIESWVEAKKVNSLAETAETALDIALAQACKKLRPRDQNAELALLMTQRSFVDYFKYALAIEVAKVIATYDQRIVAVYLFEESANPDAETEDFVSSIDLSIHLLALVTAASAALEAFVASLDRTLAGLLSELPADNFSKRISFLNIVPITAQDIEERLGYSVLMSSIYAKPVEIWKRA